MYYGRSPAGAASRVYSRSPQVPHITMHALAFVVLLALASFGLTGLLREFAQRRQWLDHPNARSSHSLPTPRGGGPGFALPYALGLFWLYTQGLLGGRELAALELGLAIAVLGLLDDLHNLT